MTSTRDLITDIMDFQYEHCLDLAIAAFENTDPDTAGVFRVLHQVIKNDRDKIREDHHLIFRLRQTIQDCTTLIEALLEENDHLKKNI